MNRRAPQRGFTLIEVLLAFVLLALLMAGAWGGIRTATKSVQSGEALIERTNKMRVAQEFMRRDLSQALSLALWQDPATGESTIFEGSPDVLTFVAQMPGYLGRGGPYVQRLSFESREGDLQLVFRHAMHNGYKAEDDPLAEPEREPVVLLEHISRGSFEYRALDDQGKLGDWTEDWERKGALPLLVRLKIEFAPEAHMTWPELVVPLMLNPQGSAVYDPFLAPFIGG